MNDPKGSTISFENNVTVPNIYADAIHRICHDMIMSSEGRTQKSEDLIYFTQMIQPSNYIKYGKGACIVGMAGILGKFSVQPSLINYEPKDWGRVLQRLEYLRTKIIRMDATVSFHPIIANYGGDGDDSQSNGSGNDGGDDHLINGALNQSIANDCLFNNQFDQVTQQCKFLQAMSYIRPTIHEVVNERRRAKAQSRAKKKKQKIPKLKDVVIPVDDECMSNMYTFIKKHFQEDDKYHDYLLSFFRFSEGGKIDPALRPLGDVLELLESRKDLSMAYCLKKTEQLLQNWYMRLYTGPPPTLLESPCPGLFMAPIATAGLSPFIPRKAMNRRFRNEEMLQLHGANYNLDDDVEEERKEEYDEGNFSLAEEEEEKEDSSYDSNADEKMIESEEQLSPTGNEIAEKISVDAEKISVDEEEGEGDGFRGGDDSSISEKLSADLDGKIMDDGNDQMEKDKNEDHSSQQKDKAEEDIRIVEPLSSSAEIGRDRDDRDKDKSNQEENPPHPEQQRIDGNKEIETTRNPERSEDYHSASSSAVEDVDGLKTPTRKRKRTNFFSMEFGGFASEKAESNKMQHRVDMTPPKTKFRTGSRVIIESDNELFGYDEQVIANLKSPLKFHNQYDSSSPLQSRPTLRSPPVKANVRLRDIITSPKKKQKHRIRRIWTEVETQAVLAGVKKYGKGRWADIKNEFIEELKHRTNVQIKDYWRTLERQGVKVPSRRVSSTDDGVSNQDD